MESEYDHSNVGDKKEPSNHRGINILYSALKLAKKIITKKINSLSTLTEGQQEFRSGSSCMDAVFVVRQVVAKSIKYNRPAYVCLFDLHKVFD